MITWRNAGGIGARMSEPMDVSRRLVAVFAADVEGYSRLMGVDEPLSRQTWSAIVKVVSNWLTGRSRSTQIHIRHGAADAGSIELRGWQRKRSGALNAPFA